MLNIGSFGILSPTWHFAVSRVLRDTDDSVVYRIRLAKVYPMVEASQSTSALTLRPDFDSFLFAKVDEIARDIPLRVVSVLAHVDLDPWAEAAGLTQMPKDSAVYRLTALLTNLPDGPSTETEAQTIAERLVSLLPAPAGASRGWSAPSVEECVPARVDFAFWLWSPCSSRRSSRSQCISPTARCRAMPRRRRPALRYHPFQSDRQERCHEPLLADTKLDEIPPLIILNASREVEKYTWAGNRSR